MATTRIERLRNIRPRRLVEAAGPHGKMTTTRIARLRTIRP
jgi:hypothetical protein